MGLGWKVLTWPGGGRGVLFSLLPTLVAQPLHLCQGMCLGELAREPGQGSMPPALLGSTGHRG